MKNLRYMGPGDIFDARQLPGFTNDPKFVFHAPHARFDSDGARLDPGKAGNVVQVTNEQALELQTYGSRADVGQRFDEVEAAPAGTK